MFSGFAQTSGTLTFSFTQTAHTSYQATKNVMAVWIQSSTGAFVKTRARNAGPSTCDHLPTWSTNSGGVANNCMGTGCNVSGATSGATLTNFSTRNFTWDGTDANGNLVADGVYKITIQSTWNHGTGSSVTTSYNFTKGPNIDSQTPASDANFTNISLAWNPSGSGISEINSLMIKVLPNPTVNGKFVVTGLLKNDVLSIVNMNGSVAIDSQFIQDIDSEFDISKFSKGTYIIKVQRGNLTKEELFIFK